MSKLLMPSVQKLSQKELKSAFPWSEVWKTGGRVHLRLDYGHVLDVLYIDPPIGKKSAAADRKKAKPDKIRKQPLFDEGLCDTELLEEKSVLFEGGYFLPGKFEDRGDRPRFVVDLNRSSGIGMAPCLLIQLDESQLPEPAVQAELARNVLFTAMIPEIGRRIYIIGRNDKFTDKGTKVKQGSAIKDEWLHEAIWSNFPMKFQRFCYDDDVMYSNAWSLDRYGREIAPDCVQAESSRRVISGNGVFKTWYHVHSLLCCSCAVHTDGEIELACEQQNGHYITELQYRRLEIIRREVEAKLQANHLRSADNLNTFILPEWTLYYTSPFGDFSQTRLLSALEK